MSAPALLDATPLAGAHSARGIGAAVRGLVGGLAELPQDDRPVLLVRAGQPVPDGFESPRGPLAALAVYRLPDPWPGRGGSGSCAGPRRGVSSTRSSRRWCRRAGPWSPAST